MQCRLGVAVWLFTAIDYQIAGRLEGDAVIEVARHWSVAWVVCVLTVNNFSHSLKSLHYLLLGADAVTNPVSDVLA